MNEDTITHYIRETFEDVLLATANGDLFFSYDPEQKFPFATIVTNNNYDDGSDLDRPGVFRLNMGISKASFLALFGAPFSDITGKSESPYDFTRLDEIMPHPTYGRMYWVCILNPGEATFETQVKPLLAEAYQLSVSKHTKPADRPQS